MKEKISKYQKILLLIYLSLFTIGFSLERVYAYEFSTDSPYVVINAQGIGEVTLYAPKNQEEYLFKTETNKLGNNSSSNITLYTNSNTYTWNIQSYDSLRYRVSNNVNYVYPSYTIVKTNIPTLEDAQSFVIRYKDLLMVSLQFIIALGVLLRWLKR